MPTSAQALLDTNLAKGGKGFLSETHKTQLIEHVTVINAIPDALERAAYLAMVIIVGQPFKDANHRTAACAAINEAAGLTQRTSSEMETWIRTRHLDGDGMDLQMLRERDGRDPVIQARRLIIRYLEGGT